jgi:hypothetical protein
LLPVKKHFSPNPRPKQYKTQFSVWNWVKYLPHDHARIMHEIATRRQQQGKKKTVFEWRGNVWTEERVQKSVPKEERTNGQQEIQGWVSYKLFGNIAKAL